METRTVQSSVASDHRPEWDALTRRVGDLTRERDAAVAAAAAERERSVVLLQQCEHLASEIFALRRGQASGWKPRLVSEESRQLAVALATIRNMEGSWFWRMRLAYVRIRSLWSKAGM